MRSKSVFVFLVLALTALLLATAVVGCGGTSAPAPGSGGVREIKVEGSEFKFTPSEVTVKAGEKFKLTLTNKGTVDHTWVLLAADGKTEVARIDVKVGGTGSKEITAPAAGTYTVDCDIAGHKEAGMIGKLIVQ